MDVSELLASCVVRVSAQGARGGSGFWVAPGMLLTCAHVVAGRRGDQAVVAWGGRALPGRVIGQEPPEAGGRDPYPPPDLALIVVDQAVEHPCAWLGDELPSTGEQLSAVGITETWGRESGTREPVLVTFDGVQDVDGTRLLKVSSGEIVPGMSGGPLLRLSTGRVCGVLKTTRDVRRPRGGWGTPIGAAAAAWPELRVAHDQFHERAPGWKQVAEGWEQLGHRLFEPAEERAPGEAPSFLLRPEYGVVPFRRRESELHDLEAWCHLPGALSVRLLTGPGGQGKTRLARELCGRMASRGWLAGLLRSKPEDGWREGLGSAGMRRLLVLDYAETRTGQLGELIELLHEQRDADRPVRVLLLSRSVGDWWQKLSERSVAVERVVAGAQTVGLAPLEETRDGRRAAFLEAVECFADARQVELAGEPAESSWPEGGSALQLHLAALAAVLRGTEEPGVAAPGTSSETVLTHERRYWRRAAEASGIGLQSDVLEWAVAAATLCGARSEGRAVALLAALPGLADDDLRRRTARLVGDLYPGTAYWNAVQPDRLGEDFLAQVVSDADWLLRELLARADGGQVEQALTVLNRVAQAHERVAMALVERVIADPERLGPTALEVTIESETSDALLRALDRVVATAESAALLEELSSRLPQRSLRLGDLAVSVSARLVLLHTRHAERVARQPRTARLRSWLSTWGRSNVREQAERGRLLNNLSARMAKVGRHGEGLKAGQESVKVYRRLARRNPDSYLPNLATSLNNLAEHLAKVGRREEGLQANAEAVKVFRRLARGSPRAHLAGLAGSLNDLSLRLAEIGRRGEGLETSRESVEVYRKLAEANPDAHLPNLATALSNLSLRLGEMGRHQDGLRASEEAARVYRELVAASPDAYLPGLAMSLTSLSLRLGEMGRSEEGLRASEEAVSLYRRLANMNPGAYLVVLAQSLNIHAVRLGEVDQDEAALRAVEEAVVLYRKLAEANPDAHLPALAISLYSLSVRLGEMGRAHEGLRASQEAVQAYRRLARGNPDAYLPGLGLSLLAQSVDLGEVGRPEVQVRTSEEAVRVYRKLAEANPDSHLPGLATSLMVYSMDLDEAGRGADGLRAVQEAVQIYRQLAAASPDTHLPSLATALNNFAVALGEAGRHEEKLQAIEEAVAIWRTLGMGRPDRFREDLVKSLGNQADALERLGRADEARAVRAEADQLRGGS